jgi:outer membrane receptor protein involved in Fe transport
MKVRGKAVLRVVLATTALGLPALPALGQSQSGQQTAQPRPADVGDIVVTATRQSETISRVPMSITAQTQSQLDERNIKTAQDLSRIVPALRIEDSSNGGAAFISVRGIRSETGSATTGVYIDDTALQARTLGGTAVGGGVFLPPIFDLERVEVLKGPQGTLYGGSSEGGTVRFISPEPSLTRFSLYGRAEVNAVEYGGIGYEGGLAVGVPLVEDKLGVRLSAWNRHSAGYLDFVDHRNSEVVSHDDNWRNQRAFRIVAAWQPSPSLKITPSFLYSYDNKNKMDETYRAAAERTTPAFGTYLDAAPAGSPAGTPGRGSPLFGRYASPGVGGGLLPAGYTPPPGGGIVTDIPGALGRRVFIHPAHTYPAVTVDPYSSFQVTNAGDDYTGPVVPNPSGRLSKMYLGSLTLDWDVGPAQIKSITSYLRDSSKGVFDASYISSVSVTTIPGYDPSVNSSFLFDSTDPVFSYFAFHSKREAKTQELRLVYPTDDNGIGFVAGVYYNDAQTSSISVNTANRSIPREASFDIPQTFYAVHSADDIASMNQQTQVQNLGETSTALYGEANYQITDKLRLTAGVRFAREEVTYDLRTWGLLTNAPFGVGTYVQGSTTEKPITPKASISYQATPDQLYYITASKGYRPGGAQGQANPIICASDLAALNVTETPSAYGSDSVWNYEAGAKVKLFDRRLALSGSVFHVVWNKPQTPYRLPTCAFQYVTNIGEATSTGFDLEGSLRAFDGLTIDFALGYTDAHFTKDVMTEPSASGVRNLLVGKGMPLIAVPAWTGSIGARYDFALTDRWKAYVFGNYQYTGSYKNTLGPGVLSYSPDVYTAPAVDNVTARLGFSDDHFDISMFVDNLFASKKLEYNYLVGRASCRSDDCALYGAYYPLIHGTTLRPRTWGLTVTARY